MTPQSPVIEGHEQDEVVYAKDQPPYRPLPVLPICDGVISRWRLSLRERLTVLFRGDVYLQQLNFGQPLQPVLLRADLKPEGLPEFARYVGRPLKADTVPEGD